MAFPAIIDRTRAEGLLAEQPVGEVIEAAVASSAALASFRRVNMGTKVGKMPVLAALPSAGFVTENLDATGVKPVTAMSWAKRELIVEEIAAIAIVHEDVLADATMNLWDEVRPRIAEAIGAVLDAAVFFGVNKPATWPAAIFQGATAAGNTVESSGGAATTDLADDINAAWALVEADGYDVNAQYTNRSLKSALRGLRSKDGVPLYLSGLTGTPNTDAFYGAPLYYVNNGSWDATLARMIVGDRSMAILGIRQDVTYKIVDQATFGTGTDQINLVERDMLGIRAKFRVAFQVATPISRANPTGGYPFAVLTPYVA